MIRNKHFDMDYHHVKYDMKVNYEFHILIFFVCDASYKNKIMDNNQNITK
jgi:hypothetical protein